MPLMTVSAVRTVSGWVSGCSQAARWSNRLNVRNRANMPFFSFLMTFFQEKGSRGGVNDLKSGMIAGVRFA